LVKSYNKKDRHGTPRAHTLSARSYSPYGDFEAEFFHFDAIRKMAKDVNNPKNAVKNSVEKVKRPKKKINLNKESGMLNFFLWNVRGMGNPEKAAAILRLVDEHEIDAIILTEIQESASAFRLRHEELFSDWAIVGSSRKHRFGGGVVLMVRKRPGGGKVEVRWSGGAQERGAEVSSLRGVYKGQSITILAAYVTPNREIVDSGSRLRHSTITAITKLVQIAHDRGDKVILLGDLNVGFTKTQICELDGSLSSTRVSPDFDKSLASFTTSASRDEFSEITKWNLKLRNGLWSENGTCTHTKTNHLLDQVWMSSDLEGSSVCTLPVPQKHQNKGDEVKALSDHHPVVVQWNPFKTNDAHVTKQIAEEESPTANQNVRFDEWDDFDRSRFNHLVGEKIKRHNGIAAIDDCGSTMVTAAQTVEQERRAAKPRNKPEMTKKYVRHEKPSVKRAKLIGTQKKGAMRQRR